VPREAILAAGSAAPTVVRQQCASIINGQNPIQILLYIDSGRADRLQMHSAAPREANCAGPLRMRISRSGQRHLLVICRRQDQSTEPIIAESPYALYRSGYR
jgi:hypothetical protein